MTMAERRQREKNQRSDDIINAAERLFFSRGYENVSMEEIASEVELSKAALYFYFKDKESLFFAVVNRGMKLLRAIIIEEVKNTQDDDIKFCVFNTAFCRFALEYPNYSKAYAYFRSGKFDISNNKDISIDAKEIDELTKEIFEMTVSEIKISVENRTFRSDINPVVLAVLVASIGNSISDMSPSQREMLKTHGITMQQFYLEATNLLNRMFINTEDGMITPAH